MTSNWNNTVKAFFNAGVGSHILEAEKVLKAVLPHIREMIVADVIKEELVGPLRENLRHSERDARLENYPTNSPEGEYSRDFARGYQEGLRQALDIITEMELSGQLPMPDPVGITEETGTTRQEWRAEVGKWGHQCSPPPIWWARLRRSRVGREWTCTRCRRVWKLGYMKFPYGIPGAPLIKEWRKK